MAGNDDVDKLAQGIQDVYFNNAGADPLNSLKKNLHDTLSKYLTKSGDDLLTPLNITVKQEFRGKEKKINITRIMNPLEYAWPLHQEYNNQFPQKNSRKILFVAMNPSPESRTGIPFYEEKAMEELFGKARHFELLNKFPQYHTANITSESGRRFWKFMLEKFGFIQNFYEHCFLINYCPLIFLDTDGSNVNLEGFNGTSHEFLSGLMIHCDEALEATIHQLNPQLCVGIGWFAYNRLQSVAGLTAETLRIRHPSPLADNGIPWDVKVDGQLNSSEIWADLMDSL